MAAHIHAMEAARALGVLRDVHGTQYPVPERSFLRWEAQQKEQRRQRAVEALRRISPRDMAESLFS